VFRQKYANAYGSTNSVDNKSETLLLEISQNWKDTGKNCELELPD